MTSYNIGGFSLTVGERYILDNLGVTLKKIKTTMHANTDIINIDFRFIGVDGSIIEFSEFDVIQAYRKGRLSVTPYVTYMDGLSDYYSGDYSSFGLGKHQTKLPNKVIFNEKKGATTLLHGKNNATVVKTTKEDKYDKKFGFLLAYFQYYSGLSKTQANKYLNNIIKENVDEKN